MTILTVNEVIRSWVHKQHLKARTRNESISFISHNLYKGHDPQILQTRPVLRSYRLPIAVSWQANNNEFFTLYGDNNSKTTNSHIEGVKRAIKNNFTAQIIYTDDVLSLCYPNDFLWLWNKHLLKAYYKAQKIQRARTMKNIYLGELNSIIKEANFLNVLLQIKQPELTHDNIKEVMTCFKMQKQLNKNM
ncbi:MAG: hypothetical protein OEZ01_04345 [Candidatus Heimdallarchaeota archaeon]|nr:hypothetical protein [Candidatus Heimdallarchaeota archaeon]